MGVQWHLRLILIINAFFIFLNSIGMDRRQDFAWRQSLRGYDYREGRMHMWNKLLILERRIRYLKKSCEACDRLIQKMKETPSAGQK